MPERCHGPAETYCPLWFRVSCPCPASERSVGLRSSCTWWVWKGPAHPSGVGPARPGVLGPSSSQALSTCPRAQLLGTRDQPCVLGDSRAPNSPGNSGSSRFQGRFQLYSSGKTLALCLVVCSDPRSWEKLPSAGSLPSLAPSNPRAKGSCGQRVSFTSVPAPERCPGVSVERHSQARTLGPWRKDKVDKGLRRRQTKKGRVGEQGLAREGAVGWTDRRMRETQDALGSCHLALEGTHRFCATSPLRSHTWREKVAGASPGCPGWPPAGSLLSWPFLLSHSFDLSSQRAAPGAPPGTWSAQLSVWASLGHLSLL